MAGYNTNREKSIGEAMAEQYRMTLEENVFYAKRNVVDSIWKEANIEGIAVTFPDTLEIFEGRAVAGLSIDATIAINNLKHAWQFLFDSIDAPVNLAYVRQMNGIIGANLILNAGELRQTDVSVGGTSWRPEIPDYDSAKAEIERIASKLGLDAALEMFAYLTRSQLFFDGNKRCAQLIANKMLIQSGSGVLSIPIEEKLEFSRLLVEFYETGDRSELCRFLEEHAIDGLNLR